MAVVSAAIISDSNTDCIRYRLCNGIKQSLQATRIDSIAATEREKP